MKLYELKFTVRTGELEFHFVKLYNADGYNEAGKKAHQWCSGFYGDEDDVVKLDKNSYEFDCGCIIVTMNSIEEIDKEVWKEDIFNEKFGKIE